MVRIKALASQFQDYSFLANNRNPYANCASILYRHYDAKNISTEERIKALKKVAKKWLLRSETIKDLILTLNVPLLTYEQFCGNPAALLTKLKLPDGVAETIDCQAEVKVKDYQVQRISNQNQRQIANLSNEEIEEISRILSMNEELLSFFGYEILPTT